MKKYFYYGLAIACLGALGLWAYLFARAPVGPAIEIGAPRGAAPATASAAQSASGAAPSRPAGAAPSAAGAAATGPAGSSGGGGVRAPVGVEVAQAVTVALADDVFAVGNLRANESVMIRPEIAGRIVRIGFAEGSLIRKGEMMVELDRSVLLAQAEQARAELQLSKANFDRTADLAARNFVSESAKDQAAANLSVQDAKLRLAEAQLGKTQIFAPFSGVVGLRNFSVGDYVREGADLVVLEDVSRMKVDLRLPERFLGELQRGQVIDVRFDAFPNRGFRAVLDALDAQVSADGRALIARGSLDNTEAVLRSGMFARARIVLKEKPESVVVPEEAINPAGADLFVYRVIDGKAVRTKVVGGSRRDGKVEILQGLSAGDVVITAGQLKIQRDGTEVRVQGAPVSRPASQERGR